MMQGLNIPWSSISCELAYFQQPFSISFFIFIGRHVGDMTAMNADRNKGCIRNRCHLRLSKSFQNILLLFQLNSWSCISLNLLMCFARFLWIFVTPANTWSIFVFGSLFDLLNVENDLTPVVLIVAKAASTSVTSFSVSDNKSQCKTFATVASISGPGVEPSLAAVTSPQA